MARSTARHMVEVRSRDRRRRRDTWRRFDRAIDGGGGFDGAIDGETHGGGSIARSTAKARHVAEVRSRDRRRWRLRSRDRRRRRHRAVEASELQLKKRKQRKIKGNSRLSFIDDIENGSEEEEEENETSQSKKFRHGKYGKDPTVETSFLPDSEREAEEQAERERLQRQWILEQEQIRSNYPLQITYSYWDGAGSRRVLQVWKGDAIGEFLRAVQQQLAPEFREIRTTLVENLLYVKDLIIPHQHSFYELIVNKVRGKSGLLFHFDVHENVRTIADATIEKDESHGVKVVERHWYEKNKHISPALRWETSDPTRKWERYTIHGD
ncbi:hypothetical protein ACJW31_07G139400 [Castanea mollissima]